MTSSVFNSEFYARIGSRKIIRSMATTSISVLFYIVITAAVSPEITLQYECSGSCPEGMYESSPCTNDADRICKECSKCGGSSYEVRACRHNKDRQCLHIAHPVLNARDATFPVILEDFDEKKPEHKKRKKMKVEHSHNVNAEDLHSTRNLGTTYYVTDITQASDFYWDRESGLRVNVGIENVHLIPRYEDVDADGDNKYMTGNPNNSEDQNKFRTVVRNYCRNPIPDYYSITLEISRDRTTAAQEIICDSSDSSRPRCPPGYADGDRFLYRTLNEACQKMGTFPDHLGPAANSIVCTDNSALLREIFNQTHSIERPISFPHRKCKTAASRCDQCLRQPRCLALDIFERKCCQLDCYTLLDCKLSVSAECTSVPVECAMGDAYRYTVQPVFENIKTEFQCHMTHKRFDVLYELFYFVQVPGTDFKTPKIHRTVRSGELKYESLGEFQTDYLTVEHNTGLSLEDEFILIGKDAKHGKTNFSVHALKLQSEFRKKKPPLHQVSHNILVASAQFERPFDYSTSSWVIGNDCNKNVSKIKFAQKHYSDRSQDVNVMTQQSAIGNAFAYYLKSVENPPFIRFTVPGNMSILPYYFGKASPHLLLNDSLVTELYLTAQGRLWEIHISGRMSGCPSYVGITINDRAEREELFRYDLLILCPSDFSITFKVPNKGQDVDKTFDVHLVDGQRSYDVYLTQLSFEQGTRDVKAQAVSRPHPHTLPLSVIAVVAGIIMSLLILFTVAHIYKELSKTKSNSQSNFQGSQHVSYELRIVNGITDFQRRPANHRQRRCCCCVCSISHRKITTLYFLFWTVYSLLFTFTVFIATLSMVLRADLTQLSRLSVFHSDIRNVTVTTSDAVQRFATGEISREMNVLSEMQRACGSYIGELYEGLAEKMENSVTGQHVDLMYGANTSISVIVKERLREKFEIYLNEVERFVTDMRMSLSTSTSTSVNKYRKYLSQVLNSDWFSFAQRLFNSSEAMSSRALQEVAGPLDLLGASSDFGAFLEMEEVEHIQLWPVQFWQRFYNKLPRIPELPIPRIRRVKPQCDSAEGTHRSRPTKLARLENLDSSYFFSTSISDIETESKTKSTINVAEEYRLLPGGEKPRQHHNHASYLSQSFDIDIFRIVFLILDALLLLYRFSSIYVNGMIISKHFSAGEIISNGVDEFGQDPKWEYDKCNNTGLAECERSGNSTVNRSNNRTFSTADTYPADEYIYPVENHCTQNSNHRQYDDSERVNCQIKTIMEQEGENYSMEKQVKISCCQNLRSIIGRILESDVMPKLVGVTILVVLFCVVNRASAILLDGDWLTKSGSLGVYVNAFNVQINQTNTYLKEEAKYLNDITMDIYARQMKAELQNLQGLLDYFNFEQRRLLKNYLLEACAVNKSTDSNWTCPIHSSFKPLDIPILQCNFLPVHTNLYTGALSLDDAIILGAAFEPLLHSAKQIVLRTCYALSAALSLMLIVHIISALLYYHLNMSDTVTASILEASPMSAARDYPDGQLDPGAGLGYRQAESPCLADRHCDSPTDEMDDDKLGPLPVVTRSCLRGGSLSHDDGILPAELMAADFKYSETKV